MFKLQRLKLEHQNKLEESYNDWERKSIHRGANSRRSSFSGAGNRKSSIGSRNSVYSQLSFIPQKKKRSQEIYQQ